MTLSSSPYAAFYPELARRLPGHGTGWVDALRARALARAESLGLPGTHQESWKYMPLHALRTAAFPPALAELSDVPLSPSAFTGWEAVLVDGHFLPSLSRLDGLPEGVRLTALRDLFTQPHSPLEATLHQAIDTAPHALDAYAFAFAADGLVIDIAPGTVLEKPLHLRHITTSRLEGKSLHSPLLIRLGANAQATLMEQIEGTGRHWVNQALRITLERDARLNHILLQEASPEATLTSTGLCHLQGNSDYRQHLLALGGAAARQELHTHLLGPQAHASLNGAYLGQGRQTLDHYLPMIHQSPHCRSEQRYHGVLGDQSRGVFYGKIIVPVGAHGTEAHQQSRALLLSPTAEADNRPELEILNDDVVCSHGSAIGTLDENALYYLQARGLAEAEARRMLIEGFMASLFDDINCAAIHTHLLNQLRHALPKA